MKHRVNPQAGHSPRAPRVRAAGIVGAGHCRRSRLAIGLPPDRGVRVGHCRNLAYDGQDGRHAYRKTAPRCEKRAAVMHPAPTRPDQPASDCPDQNDLRARRPKRRDAPGPARSPCTARAARLTRPVPVFDVEATRPDDHRLGCRVVLVPATRAVEIDQPHILPAHDEAGRRLRSASCGAKALPDIDRVSDCHRPFDGPLHPLRLPLATTSSRAMLQFCQPNNTRGCFRPVIR